MKLSLEGKVAVITGGSRGIGAATVRMFVGAGARVLFNYEKARSAAEKLMADLGADMRGGPVQFVRNQDRQAGSRCDSGAIWTAGHNGGKSWSVAAGRCAG